MCGINTRGENHDGSPGPACDRSCGSMWLEARRKTRRTRKSNEEDKKLKVKRKKKLLKREAAVGGGQKPLDGR